MRIWRSAKQSLVRSCSPSRLCPTTGVARLLLTCAWRPETERLRQEEATRNRTKLMEEQRAKRMAASRRRAGGSTRSRVQRRAQLQSKEAREREAKLREEAQRRERERVAAAAKAKTAPGEINQR